jgi:hypothetical protein
MRSPAEDDRFREEASSQEGLFKRQLDSGLANDRTDDVLLI